MHISRTNAPALCHSPPELVTAADDWVQLPCLGHLREVARVFCERGLVLWYQLLVVGPTVEDGARFADRSLWRGLKW